MQGESVPKRGVPQPIRGGPIKFGPYLLEARIAVGGTAEVYLARPTPPESGPAPRLIVKRLLPHFLSDPEGRTMFEREAALHTAVQHENVVTVYGSGLSDTGEPYLAMEYIDGVDTYRLLRRFRSDGQTVPVHIAVHVVREVLRALDSVHSATDPSGTPLGIIHRDVTPSNLYLSKDGRVKLGDFGIARSTQRTTMRNAASAMLKGKIAYLAPEQVAGEPFDYRADLFSVATVLTEMLIGQPLFPGAGQLAILLAIRDCRIDPLREAEDRLPPPLFASLVRALSRDPLARFQSAAAFADALRPYDPTPEATRRELGIFVGRAQSTPSSDQLAAVRAGGQSLRARAESIPSAPEPPRRPPPPGAPKAPPPLPPRPPRRDSGASAIELDEPMQEDGDGDPATRKTAEYAPLPSFVVLSNGDRRGPWSFARLVEAIATGELGSRDRVAYMGRDLQPVEEIEELVRFLPAKTSTTNRLVGPGAPDFHDDLHATTMMEVLLRILENQETGVLFVEGLVDGLASAGRKELYFKSGKLLHVASSNASELLGEYLVGRGALKREELEVALAVLPRYGGRIGDTLIALGLVGPVDIFRAIREQGRDRVADIFRWRRGTVSFYREHAPPHVEFPLDLELPELILAGLEASMPDDTPLEDYEARMDRVLGRGPADRPRLAKSVKWPPLVAGVLALCAAPIAVRDLLQRTCGGVLGSGDVLRAVEILLAARLIAWQEG